MIKQFIKKLSPRTLYGRAAAILLLPMLTLQLAVTIIFVQRHFEDVTAQMTQNLLREISLVLSELETTPLETVAQTTGAALEITLTTWDGQASGDARVFYDISGRTVVPILYNGLDGVRDVDLSNLKRVTVALDSASGPIEIQFARGRVSASNPHQLLVLMVFTGMFMTLIAFLFLRNQLRPIKRLARAATAFGRGLVVPFHPSGAIEVRAAGTAFLRMRERIERQIEQRTMMLSGISHDLRTPITRLQLGLSLMDDEDAKGLQADVTSLQRMVDSFLSYARDSAGDPVTNVDFEAMFKNTFSRVSPDIELNIIGDPRPLALREIPMSRAMENLGVNALRYGTSVKASLIFNLGHVVICVEDNGPGIPEERHAEALRPFIRLEPSRNQNDSGGVGLGLAIAADVARVHGGHLELRESETLGGLSATITLPQ